MIKYWQSMHDYLYFLNESKIHFDSSERMRIHSELWKPWQELRFFNTDREKPKGRKQKAQETRPKLQRPLPAASWTAKTSLLILNRDCNSSFTMLPFSLPSNAVLSQRNTLPFPATAPHDNSYERTLLFHDHHDRNLHPSGCPL